MTEEDKSKTVVVLEQTGSHANDPEDLHARGYKVKEIKEVNCDHPKTRTSVNQERTHVVEACSVCGKKERQKITTNLQPEE